MRSRSPEAITAASATRIAVKGDVIIAADGRTIRSAAQLRNKISLTQIGERLQRTLARNGAISNVFVEVTPTVETTGKVYSSRQQ
jgi:S1-C subfamily serine protease